MNVVKATGAGALLTELGADEVYTRTDALGARNFLTDALGSTLGLADDAGTVQTAYAYQAYGGTAVAGQANGNPFQFTGRENDGATGLYYYRARYYHPGLGRFISEDPAGYAEGVNLYGYVSNQPQSARDPLGLWSGPAHKRIFKSVFGNMPNRFLYEMVRGSEYVDRVANQWSGDPAEHAMRRPGEQVGDAMSRTCRFIRLHMRMANDLFDRGDLYGAAFQLGQAFHPIMDSTSPVHTGWQVWRIGDTVGHAAQEQNRNLTDAHIALAERLMRSALSGDPCSCVR